MKITIEIDHKNEQAKAFLAYLKTLDFITLKEKSPYDPEFVEMVQKSAKSKNRTKVNPRNVWESL